MKRTIDDEHQTCGLQILHFVHFQIGTAKTVVSMWRRLSIFSLEGLDLQCVESTLLVWGEGNIWRRHEGFPWFTYFGVRPIFASQSQTVQ